MDSKTDLCNAALAHLGSQKFIEDFDNDRSPAGRACRLFYDTALRASFRDFDWPFTTKFVTLALVTEDGVDDTHPTEEYAYAYRYPSEALKLRRLLNPYSRLDTKASQVKYRLIRDGEEIADQDASSGSLILADLEDAEAEITVLREDVERYPDDFKLAFSRRLASYIAPMVTGGDPFKMQEKNLQLYMMEVMNARANSGIEEAADEVPDAQYLYDRNSEY